MQQFQPDPGWIGYHPKPSQPKFRLPAGAVDAHCHVFGAGDVFPYAPERKYTPVDAPKEKLFALRDFLGFERNVIVQATCHGADNSALMDALRSAHGKARGVATINPDFSDDALGAMSEEGVRGIRLNFVRRLVNLKPDDYYFRLVEKVTKLGWHIVIYFEAEDLEDRWDFFTALPATVVVDHMGRPDVEKPVDGPDFQRFLRLMDDHKNFWCKVTCPERLSKTGPDKYDDVIAFARTVVEAFSDRVLWGTDWPHPNMTTHAPDDGKLVDFIPRIAPTEELQQKLLVSNPLRLYWEI